MKTWLAQFRISAALDRRLNGGPPPTDPPPGLHRAIMAAVRAHESAPTPAKRLAIPRWALASACMALALCAFWGASHRLLSRFAPSPFNSSASSRLNQQVAALPSTLLSPLSQEWQSLNVDMKKTAEFLVSSIP